MSEDAPTMAKKTFVPVRVDANTIIRIEATPLSDSAQVDEDEYVKAVSLPSFDDITNHLKGVAKAIVGVWEEIKPSKATVEFGIEIGFVPGQVTALFVQGSSQATFNVTLEWAHDPSGDAAGKPKTP